MNMTILEILKTKKHNFVTTIYNSKFSPQNKKSILLLCKKDGVDLITDITANWFDYHYGYDPLGQDFIKIPSVLIRKTLPTDPNEFFHLISDHLKSLL